MLGPSDPKVCIDIGAHEGDYSLRLLRQTRSRVISFEPLPTAFQTLQQRLRPFGVRAIAVNKGVGIVDMVTLDDHLRDEKIEEIGLIKIDTEGYEEEVLAGAALSKHRFRPRFIQIEFNRHHLFRGTSLLWFADRLPNYDVYQLLPGGWIRRDPADPLANVFEYSNFVFVRS